MASFTEKLRSAFDAMMVSIIDTLLGGFSPPEPEPVYSDPLNYTVQFILKNSELAEGDFITAILQRFPGSTEEQAKAWIKLTGDLLDAAFEFGIKVNSLEMEAHAASQVMKKEFPEVDDQNLGNVVLRALLDTR